MPTKSQSKRTADHQFDVAAGKRARTPLSSDTETDASPPNEDSDDDVSDLEEKRSAGTKKVKAPPAKRRKIQADKASETSSRKVKAPMVVSGQTLPTKIPLWAQGSEGTVIFSVGWWKEITAKDAFWKEFDKRVPKATKAKRLSVNVALDLETDAVNPKIEEDGEASKTSRGRPAKRSTGRREVKSEKGKRKPSIRQEMPDSTDDELDLESVQNGKLKAQSANSTSCVLPQKKDVLSRVPKEKFLGQKEKIVEQKKNEEKTVQHLASSEDEDDLIILGGSNRCPIVPRIMGCESRATEESLMEHGGVSASGQDASSENAGDEAKVSTSVASVSAFLDNKDASENPRGEEVSDDIVIESIESENRQGKATENSREDSKGSWEPTKF